MSNNRKYQPEQRIRKIATGETAAVINYVTAASDRVLQSISVRLDNGGHAYWWERDVEDASKEVWEMSMSEFALHQARRSILELSNSAWREFEYYSKNASQHGFLPGSFSSDKFNSEKEKKQKAAKKNLDIYSSLLDNDQKALEWGDFEYAKSERLKVIKQALSEGKPVPAEVLEDYPELKPTVKANNLKMATTNSDDELRELYGKLQGDFLQNQVYVLAWMDEKGDWHTKPKVMKRVNNAITERDTNARARQEEHVAKAAYDLSTSSPKQHKFFPVNSAYTFIATMKTPQRFNFEYNREPENWEIDGIEKPKPIYLKDLPSNPVTNDEFEKMGVQERFFNMKTHTPAQPKPTKPTTADLRRSIIRVLFEKWKEAEYRMQAGSTERLHLTDGDMNKLAIELLGTGYDKQFFWEVAELAWVMYYRKNIREMFEVHKRFEEVYDWCHRFYNRIQPTYNYSNSTKRIFQQYSTSAPVALLAGWFTESYLEGNQVLEPSGGNGLLTIIADAKQVTVNEIDPLRLENLHSTHGEPLYGYRQILNQDGAKPFPDAMHRKFDCVQTNPPFGTLPEWNFDFGDFRITKLDHVMCAHALNCLKDDGLAALIIGEWTHFTPDGRIKDARTFFNYLGRYFRIVDMINIESGPLYNKQGTAYPLRMILIAGRKRTPSGAAPTLDDLPDANMSVRTWPAIYERVRMAKIAASHKEPDVLELLEIEIEKMTLELT